MIEKPDNMPEIDKLIKSVDKLTKTVNKLEKTINMITDTNQVYEAVYCAAKKGLNNALTMLVDTLEEGCTELMEKGPTEFMKNETGRG